MAQAAAVRQLLRHPVRSLRSSPLTRARTTAELLDLRVPIEIDERWVEVDYGEFECQPLSDIPAGVWQEWRNDPGFRPTGGETLAEVDTRIAAACEELFAAPGLGARATEGDVVVVSHADQGGGGLGPRRRRRSVVASPSEHRLGDPHRVGQRCPRSRELQRSGARSGQHATITTCLTLLLSLRPPSPRFDRPPDPKRSRSINGRSTWPCSNAMDTTL